MFVIAVANVKGGSGKSTVATHLAAHFAISGRRTVLGELDPQETALSWLKRRPKGAAAIAGADLHLDGKIPKKADVLVVDAGAAMDRDAVKAVVKRADLIVVPVLPSIFDEDATRRFLKDLQGIKQIRKNKRDVVFLGNRVKPRTRAAERLTAFLNEIEFPAVTNLRDTQLYAHAAEQGLSIFEMGGGSRTRRYLDEWEPLLAFIEASRRGEGN